MRSGERGAWSEASCCPPAEAGSPLPRSLRWLSTAISRAVRARRASPSLALAQCSSGVVVELNVEHAVAAFFVGEGAADDPPDRLFVQRLESEDLRPADQGGVDGEEGVFRRGPDERDDALLDVAEQHVLLGLVEAVDLVEEEDRAPAVVFEPAASVVEDVADVLDAHGRGVAPLKGLVGGSGDDLGEGGFSRAGRAVEQHAGQGVGGEHASKHPAFAEEVLLPDELVERAGPHADGQGLSRGSAFFLLLLPQIGHPAIVAGRSERDRVGCGVRWKLMDSIRGLRDGGCNDHARGVRKPR